MIRIGQKQGCTVAIGAVLLALGLSVTLAFAGKPSQVQCSTFGWCKIGTVKNVKSNYTPVVQLGGSQIRVYSNTNGSVDGNLYLRVGSWSTVGSSSLVLHIDSPRDQYIRTSAVVQGASGNYYALLYTGDGYPTQGGYSPSWATSPDGYDWTWHGPITIFGRNQSSAAALIVDESRTDAYACMAWIDLSWIGLVLMHAPMPCAPAQWTSDGLNVWPIPGESPQFVTAARTQYGVHLIGTSPSSSTGLMHIFSCTGLPPWNIIEQNSAVAITGVNGLGGKGTNLVFDAPNNLLHALTSSWHFQMPVRAFPC